MDNKRKIVFGPDVSFAGTEAYKLLRTNLMFALPTGKKCQMIGVTSSMRGEGKSTTALNLAYTIAQNGEKVLLVDADMRLPSIHQELGIENGKGLSNILAGMTSLESVLLKPEGDRNFSLILAGDIPPNPSELLNSRNMDKYLEMWAYYFDYIIFDFPPVLPGAMFLLSYYADGRPVLGLPGCVMHSKVTVFDLIFPRILAGEKITMADIAAFGHGGLCSNCAECHYPNCHFGK